MTGVAEEPVTRKSPTLDVAARLVSAAGFDIALEPRIEFEERAVGRGRPVLVPTRLPSSRSLMRFGLLSCRCT
jgi:hypothetical protein